MKEAREMQENTDEAVKKNVLPYLKDISVVLCVMLVFFLFLFRIVVVDGSSMYDTLIDGDYVILLNHAISGQPKQGDIVVVSKSTYKNGTPIIKRVIATQGQKVDINFETGIVSVDGIKLDEPYINTPTNEFEGVYFPLIVDEGCIFVMGDNRNVSKDSRNPEIGQIDCREVVGKAIAIVLPGEDPLTKIRDYKRIGAISNGE